MEAYASATQVFVAGLVFARVGAIVMVLPGIGETAVSPRIRLALALLLALAMTPLAAPHIPALPQSAAGLFGLILREILIGLMLGSILRLFMSALATAGEIVSLQTTLSFAQTANPLEAQPSASLSTFLTLLGLTLVFATNLHHAFLTAIADSYTLFPPGKALPLHDAGMLAIRTVGGSFALGLQLAAPVVVFALVFNVATGLVGRLLPQFQVFFVATPLSVLMGLSIFALSLGVMGMVWIGRYRELVSQFTHR